MKSLKKNIGSLLLCLFELLVGVLLLVNPVGFTSGIIIALGILLLLLGLVLVVRYFRAEAVEAASNQLLAKGLTALVAGGFCVVKSHWFVITFPLLTILYGVFLLLTGLGRIQWTVDILRLKEGRWYLAAISAVLSILCAVVILSSPFTSTAVLWMFTGISLIVEAVFDVIALLFSGRKQAED